MRTAREEALARLKSVQTKLQGGTLPADQMNALFKEFTDGVMDVLSKPENAGPAVRKMRFSGVGDKRSQHAELFASLPKEVQVEWDKCSILGTLLKKDPRETALYKRLMSESGEFKKAMDSTTAGEGDEWVPTGLSPALVEEVTKMGGVEALHQGIPMPTQPYELPLQLGRLTAYLASENTASSGQTALTKSSVAGMTGKLTLTAVDLAVEVLCSKHVEEDSLIAILPFLRSEVIMTLARGIEEAVINGDTTATHQDSDVHALGATDRRKAWLGYRKLALANGYSVDFQGEGNGFDFETFMKVRAKHGKYGINPRELAWLLSLEVFFRALSLKTSDGKPLVVTIDKFGLDATVKTGVLGIIGGSEVLVSEFCRDNLNASGVYDGTTTNRSAILSVHKPGFVFGNRRDARVQLLTELYAEYQQDALLSVIRKAFAPLRPIATHPAVAIGYNIALS
jgi:hypothetical protein